MGKARLAYVLGRLRCEAARGKVRAEDEEQRKNRLAYEGVVARYLKEQQEGK